MQAITDGGTRPDNSTQTLVLQLITQLQGVDATILTAGNYGAATAGEETTVDPARMVATQRSIGRQLVNRLARIFDTQPIADVFSSAPVTVAGTFSGNPAFASVPFNNRSGY